MAKIRVYELARELKMESKALLAKMKDLGIQVPSHQSTLTAAQIEKIRASMETSKPKVVVRRRRKAATDAKAPSEDTAASGQTAELAAAQVEKPQSPELSDKVEKVQAQPEAASKPSPKLESEPKNEEAKTAVQAADPKSTASPVTDEAATVKPKGTVTAEQKIETPTAAKGLDDGGAAEAASLEKPKSEASKLAADAPKPTEKAASPEMTEEVKASDKVEAGVAKDQKEDSLESMKAGSEVTPQPSEEKQGALANDAAAKPATPPPSAAPAQTEASTTGKDLKEANKDVKGGIALGINKDRKMPPIGQATQMAKKVDLSASAAAKPKERDRQKEKDREKDKEKEVKARSATKKKSFSGATIVRKATVEETEATKATEEARQRTSRREDSRGVRVTGIGVSPRMGQNEGRGAEKKEAKGPSADARGGFEESSDDGLGGSGYKWSKEKGKERHQTRKEEDEKVNKSIPSSKRRISMRDLLDDSSSLDAEPYASANRKRRTIYTPSTQQRKKDAKRRKDLKTTQITTPRAAYRVVKIDGAQITVGDLAKQLSVKASELIKKLMGQGVMATVNQNIDFDTATLIATEYGYECKNVEKTVEDVLSAENNGSQVVGRAPIITVMGHVDHGKTSILDVIRKSNVAGGESGGITQHIGAYTVNRDNFKFTFLDTPGHAAFSAMRARGAQITDIVVLVVAADDGVMPQTIEAISHAKNAGVPIIVAVNKIDKPNLNLDRLYTELSEHGVQAEEWGGEIQFVKVSALKGEGIDELLEAIQLQSEMLELKAPVDCRAEGAIVEAHLDKGRGPVATIMVTRGILKTGDFIVAGKVTGKVRAMTDHLGQSLSEAYPSTPVEIIGLTEVPMSGDQVNAVTDEKLGREVADLRRAKEDEERQGSSAAATLDQLLGKVNSEEIPVVNFVIKADTQGSVEAIISALDKLNTDKVKNMVVHKAVGGVNESDLNLAETSQGVVLAFNVRAPNACADMAEKRGIVIKYFSIIYDLVDAVKSLMAGVLPPIETEVIQGHAEVRNAINVPKIGTIAGSSVTDGKITRNSFLRLIRDEIVIYSGKVGSLRRFKDDVKEVQNGYECGISIDGYTDIKVGDVIEAYMIEESAATLDFKEI
ncbi:MAG: translation initiation factor IF-2 [Oligoflexales bacterium]|nr:translation initiation factor IF-2 [Oligoflexales bacterium]